MEGEQAFPAECRSGENSCTVEVPTGITITGLHYPSPAGDMLLGEMQAFDDDQFILLVQGKYRWEKGRAGLPSAVDLSYMNRSYIGRMPYE